MVASASSPGVTLSEDPTSPFPDTDATIKTSIGSWATGTIHALLTVSVHGDTNDGDDGDKPGPQVSVSGHRIAWIAPSGQARIATWR